MIRVRKIDTHTNLGRQSPNSRSDLHKHLKLQMMYLCYKYIFKYLKNISTSFRSQ